MPQWHAADDGTVVSISRDLIWRITMDCWFCTLKVFSTSNRTATYTYICSEPIALDSQDTRVVSTHICWLVMQADIQQVKSISLDPVSASRKHPCSVPCVQHPDWMTKELAWECQTFLFSFRCCENVTDLHCVMLEQERHVRTAAFCFFSYFLIPVFLRTPGSPPMVSRYLSPRGPRQNHLCWQLGVHQWSH